ncbi:unnamed protein product [Brassica rapa subsp. narinosa]
MMSSRHVAALIKTQRFFKDLSSWVFTDLFQNMFQVTHIYIYIYIYNIYIYIYISMTYISNFDAIADNTAEGTFVWFDGVMTKLHNLRASEAVQMLAVDVVNPEDSRIPPFIADMEGKSYTFQVMVTAYNFMGNHKTLIFSIVDELGRVRDDDVDDNGGNKDDDDNMPNGKPAPIGFASGRATGNGSDAKTGLYGTARKNPDVSSSKVVKKARVA